jgi:hypothetical protein
MLRFLILFTISLSFCFQTLNAQSIEKPKVIKFGETKSKTMMALDSICKITGDEIITPIELPTAKKSQSQVDCEKFHYFGKKRKAEFIFADGFLDMVWIHTLPEEQDTLIAGFTALYGKPTHIKEEITFFLDNGVAVRNNPHEVLFISDRLKEPYRAFLEKKSE